ncbi:3-oxoacyl-[acyl-carrier-protein] reductase FabG-like [Salvia divinorum]|uniref:(+)-borneol dehydrogenase n=1 Tax=Salvia divinorum TaxID=28513 RepID=A0ABD1FPE3_SALDI
MATKFQPQLEPWSHLPADKVVLVTGASSGLGLEFCLDLAAAGCRIIAAARRTDRLESLCDQINKMDGLVDGVADGGSNRAKVVALDVTADGPTIEAAIDKAWEAFGHVDVLINNAGVRGQVISSLEISEEEYNNTVKTNLIGSWLVSKYVGARMLSAGCSGSIINISSIAGLGRTEPVGSVAYTSSKAGLNYMTKVMALEFGAYNIRVNVVAPALFKSEITQGLFRKGVLENVVKKLIPLRTLGTTNPALTSLIRYLIHDSSNYVTGNIFIVDSGGTLPGSPIYSSL